MSSKNSLTGTLYLQLTVVGLAFAVTACSGGLSSPTDPVRTVGVEVEFQSFQLANQARLGEGVEPQLDLQESISRAARSHSQAMRDLGFFGHVDPSGNRLGTRLDQAGITFSKAAENLVKVTNVGDPAASAHSLLMSSGAHRGNILDPGFRLAGVGVAQRGDTFWITQVFVKP